jgi:hypothetical protein
MNYEVYYNLNTSIFILYGSKNFKSQKWTFLGIIEKFVTMFVVKVNIWKKSDQICQA